MPADGEVRQTCYGKGTGSSLYCVGSVSKSFVAALALILQQEGSIRLDDPVGKYLPALSLWDKDRVTLRDLLSMRSGVADYTTDFAPADYFKDYAPDELIHMGIRNSALLERGDFRYSNTNILIAKEMIEAATGKECETLIREKILVPCGLKDTFFADEKSRIHSRIIHGYSDTLQDGRMDFTGATTSWSGLACGMYSTASDIAKWADALIRGHFLSEASKQALLDFFSVRDGVEYGLCVARKMLRGQQVIFLQGNVPGYGAAVLIRGDTVYAVLCDLSDYSGGGVYYAELIADELALSDAGNR
jgi:D-alanyl-D-alanine carboxypeptidase